jgi:hypothetical protein
MMRAIIILLLGSIATKIQAQFSGYNLMEAQLGNIPYQQPTDLTTIYNQLNLQYHWKGLMAFSRLEQFYGSMPDGGNYIKFTQYSLTYRNKGLEAKLGNFYETLGRGLLLRGYEIKNSVFEDRIYRIRQGFYKDVRGAFVRYGNSWLEAKALRGRSLANQLPPNHPDNRLDLCTAGEISFFLLNQRAGAIFLNNENPGRHSQFVSLYMGGNIWKLFDYYGEIAHQTNENSDYLRFGDNDSYGGYFNLNYSAPGFGISMEWKDYHQFLIGAGLADPPTLVKEHSYKLLNRSTHVSELLDERSIQLEIFYSLNEKSRLTLNHSRGENNFFQNYRFQEYFAEWYSSSENFLFKSFFDYAFDEFKAENNRVTVGIYFTKILPNQWSVSLESEAQQFEKPYLEIPQVQNYYAGLAVNKSAKFSSNLVWEYTNDLSVADIPSTEKTEKNRHYLSISLSYKIKSKNTVQIFAGQRRGGPACSSGICYEVLDFKGLELRYATRF